MYRKDVFMIVKSNCIFFLVTVLGAGCTRDVLSQSNEQSFRKRAARILAITADGYVPPSADIGDPEKYYWPLVIARFEKYGVNDSVANHWVRKFAANSPFHFTLLGMSRILYRYPDAPAVKENRRLILQRVFERTDSYNPWTGEGTENHVNMSRSSGYLFAQAARAEGEQFPEATGRLAEMSVWHQTWARQVFRSGTGEWNSSTYLAYNALGWINVFDFTQDLEMKKIARAVLDYYASELAVHYSYGAIGGSEMRGSNSSLGSATAWLGWLWFGSDADYLSSPGAAGGNQFIQCVHAATSEYRPPDVLQAIAAKRSRTVSYRNSQPAYLLDKSSFVRRTFHAAPWYTLGSAVSKYGGWTGATSQIISWKLVLRQGHQTRPAEITGSGMYFAGKPLKGRDPFTQVIQNKNVLIQMTRVPAHEYHIFRRVSRVVAKWKMLWYRDFVKRFPDDPKENIVTAREGRLGENGSFVAVPESVKYSAAGRTVVLYADSGIVAIHSITGNPPKVLPENGRVFFIDQAPRGSLCGFVIEVMEGNAESGYASTGTFNFSQRSSTVEYTTADSISLKAQYGVSGKMEEAISEWGYGKVQPHSFLSAPPLKQPRWPSGNGFGKIPQLTVNDKPVNYNEKWPVWQSLVISLENSILCIDDGKERYIVDFASAIPDFQTIRGPSYLVDP